MRRISILIGLIFFTLGCKQTDYDYKLENDMLNCFYQHHNDNEINVKEIIDNIENIFVKYKILNDKSGESYIARIMQIRDNNDFDLDNPKLIADIDSFRYIPSSVSCRNPAYAKIDSIGFINSKFKYVIGIYDSIQAKGDISKTLVAEEILEVFNASDFENDYYKTTGIVLLANLIKMDNQRKGILGKLQPPLKQESTKIEKQNIFVIYINKDNKVLADGQLIKVSEIKTMIKRFLLETSNKKEVDLPLIGMQMTSKGVISLQNDKETSYKLYISVQNELILAYKEIRDDYSTKFFGSSFDNLDNEKKQIIKNLVPQRILEAESKI